MSGSISRFTWFELATSDVDAAQRFYGAVAGLDTAPWPDPGMAYTLWVAADGPMGGVMKIEDPGDASPQWTGVIDVTDADTTCARCTELGGKVLAPPFDIPGVGRYANLADPTGASVGIMQSAQPHESPPSSEALGRVSWCELWSTDPAASIAFFHALFGWVSKGDMDMGEMGKYRMYGIEGDERSLGGVGRAMPGQPAGWVYYFNVKDADAVAARVTSEGGTVIHGPNEVPGGGRMLMAMDPQGAAFALYSEASSA